MKNGRPPIYTPELASAILKRIADGESLRAICRDEGMPDRSVVHGWIVNNHEGFANQYARAKESGIEHLAEEIFDIADDGRNDWVEKENTRTGKTYIALNEEAIARAKLRVDARKWYLSKLAPKKYGELVKMEMSGPDGTPIQIIDKASAMADILAKAAERRAAEDKDVEGLV